MPLADSSYPLLNAFWTMFEFFLCGLRQDQDRSSVKPKPRAAAEEKG